MPAIEEWWKEEESKAEWEKEMGDTEDTEEGGSENQWFFPIRLL